MTDKSGRSTFSERKAGVGPGSQLRPNVTDLPEAELKKLGVKKPITITDRGVGLILKMMQEENVNVQGAIYQLNKRFDAFKKAKEDEKNYIRNMITNGENLNDNARIWISTIHAIKGGEEDNVILCLDLSPKIKKSMRKNLDKADEEHRVWYVAVTRARNNLYKLKGKLKKNEYKL